MSLTRRTFLAGSAAGLCAPAAAPNQPNLVYVFADQLRYQSCGYAGDEYARTPNIDRLAAQGCNFHQAISNTPVCAPYRASLMTGKYQSSTGMVINELRLSPEHETFGRALTRGGYRTAYIGKWHLWANELGHHEETRNGFVPPGPYRLGFDNYWAAYNFNHTYYRSPYFENDPTRHIRKEYEPDGQTQAAIEFLQKHAKSGPPFALFLSWGPPHDPWDSANVPPAYADLYRGVMLPKRPNYSEVSDPYADDWAKLPADYPRMIDAYQRGYYAQTANIDWNVGRLMEALDRLGLAGNTIFVFTSDHGEMFGAHGRRAKYIFYEEAARVPFLIRWPGHIPPKLTSDALLGTPDIMPTLLALLNLPSPCSVEGVDLAAMRAAKPAADVLPRTCRGWAPPRPGRTEPSGVVFATTNTHTPCTVGMAANCSSTIVPIRTRCAILPERNPRAPRCGTTAKVPRRGARNTTTRSNRAPGIATIGPRIATSF